MKWEDTDKKGGNFDHFNPEEDYLIVSKKKKTMAMDVSKRSENKNLILWKQHAEQNQCFRFLKKDGKYAIISQDGNRVLQVPNCSVDDGEKIIASMPNDSAGEYWSIIPVEHSFSTFYIISFCGKYLDAEGASTRSETKIIQWPYNGGENQMWVIKKSPYVMKKQNVVGTLGNIAVNLVSGISRVAVSIANSHSKGFQGEKCAISKKECVIVSAIDKNLALSISQNKKRELVLEPRSNVPNQRWKVEENFGEVHIISSLGGVLQISDSGKHISIGEKNHFQNERWTFQNVKESQDKFYFRSHNGKALDIKGAKIKSGTSVILWKFHGQENQMWCIQQI